MKYSVVTTFSPRGYLSYGRPMIETFAAFWPFDVPLHVYYEGEKPDDASPRAIWHPLGADPDRARFMAEHKDPEKGDYRQRPVRYSHKVFAMTAAPRDCDHLIWLDGDVETIAMVTPDHLSASCAAVGQAGSYLGRPYFRHTETGFLSFCITGGGGEVLDAFRKQYTSGAIMGLPELHDCMAYDVVRKQFERRGYRFRNICPDAEGLSVFGQSPLKDFLTHHKGVLRKEKRYGDHMIPGETKPLMELAPTVSDEIA